MNFFTADWSGARLGTPWSLAAATLGLVEGLGLQAVAEGVATDEQQRFVTERGFPLAQGFHLARPLPAADVAAAARSLEVAAAG